jgi:hypothetical protein
MIYLDTTPVLPGPEENPPTMEELTINFETNPEVRIAKGKRKAFGPEEREKVKKVRENGACFSCRARKVSVSNEANTRTCGLRSLTHQSVLKMAFAAAASGRRSRIPNLHVKCA